MNGTHPGLTRAQLLMEARRFRLAEEELRRALRDDPESALIHAYLALCLAETPARAAEARQTALWATVHDPLLPTAWYALSLVERRHGTWEAAEKAARIALGLAPEHPGLLVNLAQLMMARERYREGLELAERALAVAPDDVEALTTAGSLRSRLGRHAEARADFARALARAPDDPLVHGNAGWAALRRGDAEAGLRHFRASLRLEPGDRGAQRGMLEALRAHNAAYRAFLRVALRLFWIGPQLKWVAVAFAVAAIAYLSLADLPAWMLRPLQGAVAAAAVCTWTAPPLADLLLLGDPAGRAVLERAQKAAAVVVGALLAAALLLALASLAGAPRGTGIAAILAALHTSAVTAVPRAPPGWPRAAVAAWSVLLLVPAALAVAHWAQRGDDAGLWLGLTMGGLVMPDAFTEALPPRR